MRRKKDKHPLFNEANKEWDAGNNKLAFELFKRAAAQGDIYALNSIGHFFDAGIGVARSRKQALLWYKKAAKSGDVAAYSNIGTVYRDMRDVSRARLWFLKAFKSGDGDAALEIGKLYLQNKRDLKEAARYLRLALKSKCITEDSMEEARRLIKKVSKSGPAPQHRRPSSRK